MKKFIIVGAGYLGTPTGLILAEYNKDINFYILDLNKKLIKDWKNLKYPIFEKDLDKYLKNNINKNLFFVDNPSIYENCDIVMIAVNTPGEKSDYGEFSEKTNMKYIYSCWEDILKYRKPNKDLIIIEKSTVPVGTCYKIRNFLQEKNFSNFFIVSNPEFLSEGQAIHDLLNPQRVVLGYEKNTPDYIKNIIKDLYNFIEENKIIYSNILSSELCKLASNAMLAQKLTGINTFTGICEKMGGSINEVAEIVGKDDRINEKYIKSSYGFGGSCLPKDLKSLIYIFYSLGLNIEAQYWEFVLKVNEKMNRKFYEMIVNNLDKNGKILILGMAFKPKTNDGRCSPSINLIKKLVDNNYNLFLFDFELKKDDFDFYYKIEYNSIRSNNLIFIDDYKEFIKNNENCNIIIATDWIQFLDLEEIMIKSNKIYSIFDGKLLFNKKSKENILKNNLIKLYQIGN